MFDRWCLQSSQFYLLAEYEINLFFFRQWLQYEIGGPAFLPRDIRFHILDKIYPFALPLKITASAERPFYFFCSVNTLNEWLVCGVLRQHVNVMLKVSFQWGLKEGCTSLVKAVVEIIISNKYNLRNHIKAHCQSCKFFVLVIES